MKQIFKGTVATVLLGTFFAFAQEAAPAAQTAPAPAPTKLMYKVTKDTPIVEFEGEAKAGQTYQVLGRKTVDGVQYGRVTSNGWISLNDAKQV